MENGKRGGEGRTRENDDEKLVMVCMGTHACACTTRAARVPQGQGRVDARDRLK